MEYLVVHPPLVVEAGWESLAPCIHQRPQARAPLAPPERLVDPHRYFVGEKAPRDAPPVGLPLRVSWTSWHLTREAPSPEYVAALGADPAAVAAAEACAREACARMALFGVSPARDVVWLVEPKPRIMLYLDTVPFRARADEALRLSPERLAAGDVMVGARVPPDDAWLGEWKALAKRDLVRMHAWNEAVRVGAPLDPRNPFAPVVEIWRLSYALVAVLDGYVVLATCP